MMEWRGRERPPSLLQQSIGLFFFTAPLHGNTNLTPPLPTTMAPAKELARGIGDGRSKSYHRRGVWAVKKKNGGKLGFLA